MDCAVDRSADRRGGGRNRSRAAHARIAAAGERARAAHGGGKRPPSTDARRRWRDRRRAAGRRRAGTALLDADRSLERAIPVRRGPLDRRRRERAVRRHGCRAAGVRRDRLRARARPADHARGAFDYAQGGRACRSAHGRPRRRILRCAQVRPLPADRAAAQGRRRPLRLRSGQAFVDAPADALSCRLRARSPFWSWQVDASGLSGRYVVTPVPGHAGQRAAGDARRTGNSRMTMSARSCRSAEAPSPCGRAATSASIPRASRSPVRATMRSPLPVRLAERHRSGSHVALSRPRSRARSVRDRGAGLPNVALREPGLDDRD